MSERIINNIKIDNNDYVIQDKELNDKFRALEYGASINVALTDTGFRVSLKSNKGNVLSDKSISLNIDNTTCNERINRLEEIVARNMHYQGEDTIANIAYSNPNIGDVYKITDSGFIDGTEINEGECVVYNGDKWVSLGQVKFEFEQATIGNGTITIQQGNVTKGAFSLNQNTNQIIKLDDITSSGSVPKGIICMWSGNINDIPDGWTLCNGENGTPDLRNRFIVASGDKYQNGDKGGEDKVYLTTDQVPSHSHTAKIEANTHSHSNTIRGGVHTHKITCKEGGKHEHPIFVPESVNGWPAESEDTCYKNNAHYGTDKIPSFKMYWKGLYATTTKYPNNYYQGCLNPANGLDYYATKINEIKSIYGTQGEHTHTISFAEDSGHSHTLTILGSSHTHTIEIDSTGEGLSHENRPMYYALAYIMKITDSSTTSNNNESDDFCVKCIYDLDKSKHPIGTYALYTGPTNNKYTHSFIYEKVDEITWNAAFVQNVIQ